MTPTEAIILLQSANVDCHPSSRAGEAVKVLLDDHRLGLAGMDALRADAEILKNNYAVAAENEQKLRAELAACKRLFENEAKETGKLRLALSASSPYWVATPVEEFCSAALAQKSP